MTPRIIITQPQCCDWLAALGVMPLPVQVSAYIAGLLYFEHAPTYEAIDARAEEIVRSLLAVAPETTHLVLSCPAYMAYALHEAALSAGVVPLYSFANRATGQLELVGDDDI